MITTLTPSCPPSGRGAAKVLLFGEHSVVYGQRAIAVGVDAGVTAEVGATRSARLEVPAWGIDVRPGDDHPVARAHAALLEALGLGGSAWDLRLTADVPPGAGLGSSAALAVASARALLEAAGERADDARVYDAAMAAERIFHGNPSGLDHAAAIRGGIFAFRRGEPPEVTPLRVGGPLVFVVAQVEPGASTRAMVEGVARRLSDVGTAKAPLLESFGAIVAEAIGAIAEGDAPRVGRLMDVNHGLLVSIGVSTPQLDEGCRVARSEGALGAKLTGAGGGGCVVAVAHPDDAPRITQALAHRFGLCCFMHRVAPDA